MKIIPVGNQSFGANTYLIAEDHQAYVVDPSVSVSAILSAAADADVSLLGILLTHGHFDHVLSLDTLRDATGLSAYLHSEDAPMLSDGRKNAHYTFFGMDRVFRKAEYDLSHGQRLPLGGTEITLLHTPGHSPGSCCFLCGEHLITGDTLFADSYGRCDLWGGSDAMLAGSLRVLRTLDGSLTIHPGHGPAERLSDALDNVAYLL